MKIKLINKYNKIISIFLDMILKTNIFKSKSKIIFQISKLLSNNKIENIPQCCQSGCQNCVWLQYAEEISKQYLNQASKNETKIKQLICEVEKLTDENLKSYLLFEIRLKYKIL